MTTAKIVLAEALFASLADPSDHLTAHDAQVVAFKTFRRLREAGCADVVAREYADHPEIAVPRMAWAVELVGAPMSHGGAK
jgi:hypothetical protein